MRKFILLVVVLAVIAVGWFLYFNNGETIAMVSVSEAKYMDIENSLEFSGEIVSQEMYSVMSETGGTIDSLYVSKGSKVSRGDNLFELDKTEIECLLKQAELNYDILSETATQTVMTQSNTLQGVTADLQDQKAKVALALSQTTGYDYESFNEAFSEYVDESAAEMAASLSGMSLSDLNSLETQGGMTNISENQIAMAQLSVQALKSQLESMSYQSLIEGTVIAVNIHRGEVLAPGVPAMIIADTENILICAYVYEKDVITLVTGMDVKIHTDDGYYMGTLTKIGEAASSVGDISAFETMTEVEITPDENFKRMPGAIIDLEIILSEKSNVLALPLDCITKDGSVYVVGENDIVEKRTVQTGFEDMFNVEILSGINAGEVVVLSPQNIEEGVRITYDRG